MNNFTFNPKTITPIQQGLFVIVLIILLSIGCLVFKQRDMTAWVFIFSPIILFCFYNPIIGAFHDKLIKHLLQSILVFIFLLFFIYITGNLVSGVPFGQVGELHIIGALVIVFYILVNIVCFIFRGMLFMLEEIDKQ